MRILIALIFPIIILYFLFIRIGNINFPNIPNLSGNGPNIEGPGLPLQPRIGDCQYAKHKDLQDEVNFSCKENEMARCIKIDTKEVLEQKKEKLRRCAIARDLINKTCFRGGDLGHQEQAQGVWNGVVKCELIINDKQNEP